MVIKKKEIPKQNSPKDLLLEILKKRRKSANIWYNKLIDQNEEKSKNILDTLLYKSPIKYKAISLIRSKSSNLEPLNLSTSKIFPYKKCLNLENSNNKTALIKILDRAVSPAKIYVATPTKKRKRRRIIFSRNAQNSVKTQYELTRLPQINNKHIIRLRIPSIKPQYDYT